MDLKSKTVIVTGAGSGVGRAIAIAFAAAGAHVVCCSRRQDRLDQTCELIREQGGQAMSVAVDVTEQASVEQLVGKVMDRHGSIDVLFNNAGRFQSIAGLWEADCDEWWEDVTVNLRGPMLTSRAVLPQMIKQDEGIIINMNGGRPVGGSGYASGKAGMMEMTRLMAEELKMYHPHVLVFGAGPGLVKTEMTQLQAETEAGRRWIPSTYESFESGRLKQPHEIADKSVELVRRAKPQWTGKAISPQTDLDTFDQPQ